MVDDQPQTHTAPTAPSFVDILTALQGGILERSLTYAMAETAMAVSEHADGAQKGKVTLTLELKRGKGPFQLVLDHRLAFAHPTARGTKSETSRDHADVFVNALGALTVTPDAQKKLPLQ